MLLARDTTRCGAEAGALRAGRSVSCDGASSQMLDDLREQRGVGVGAGQAHADAADTHVDLRTDLDAILVFATSAIEPFVERRRTPAGREPYPDRLSGPPPVLPGGLEVSLAASRHLVGRASQGQALAVVYFLMSPIY